MTDQGGRIGRPAKKSGRTAPVSGPIRKVVRADHRLPPEERRAQLLRVGVNVSASKGIGRLSHAEVARACGVSTPTAFLYFPDREALVTAVIGEVDRFYRVMARQSHDSVHSPLERVYSHLFSFAESIETDRDYAMVWLEWSTHFQNEYGLWDAFVHFQEFVIAQLTKSIRTCQAEGLVAVTVSAPDSARLIVAGGYAMTQLKLMNRTAAVVERFAKQTLDQALK